MLPIVLANHDPAYFNQPDTVDLDRKDNQQMLFGHGAYKCLGQYLGIKARCYCRLVERLYCCSRIDVFGQCDRGGARLDMDKYRDRTRSDSVCPTVVDIQRLTRFLMFT